MSLARKRVNAALIFVGAAALAVCVASPAILQYRTLRFDREYREFRIEVRNWVRNPFAKIEPPPIVVEDAIDTRLWLLRRARVESQKESSQQEPRECLRRRRLR